MDLIVGRNCNGCTECCNGSSKLHGEIFGKHFHSGKPCHYVGESGCTIYENRPQDPCKRFRCEWLDNPEMFPEWMKPNLSKIIGIRRTTEKGNSILEIRECGQKIDSNILNYFYQYSMKHGINMDIEVDDFLYRIQYSEEL